MVEPPGVTLRAATRPAEGAADGGWVGCFQAMASPCEVLADGAGADELRLLTLAAQSEALRIEAKFSRYRDDSVTAGLHAARGQATEVDDETAALLDFAAHCHALSGGLFDITSGVLRRAWRFDGGKQVPDAAQVQALCQQAGWHRVHWQRPWLTLPAGMEIDFGGIGREYAVDRVLGLLQGLSARPLLVNFGGDLAVSGPRAGGQPWQVGIEGLGGPEAEAPTPAGLLTLRAGALATSGDTRRFVMHGAERLGHVLDPRNGWPVRGAPRSVTVAAPTCTEAGLLSTLALLQGPQAQEWLAAQGVPHWVLV